MTQRQFGLWLVIVLWWLRSLHCLSTNERAIELNNWQLQSSSMVNESGSSISTSSYDASLWYQNVETPSTVLGALKDQNVYDFDLYFGTNLQKIDSSDFDVSWWYRSQFILNSTSSLTILHFHGINYKANLWINEMLIANSSQIIGTLREYSFDITGYLMEASMANTIALEVFKPLDTQIGNAAKHGKNEGLDLAISYIDWNPALPDSSMGIWKPVYIYRYDSKITMQYPMVNASVSVGNLQNLSHPSSANLTIMIEVNNYDQNAKSDVELIVEIEELSISISKQITLAAGEKNKQIFFDYNEFLQLQLNGNAHLWWPYQFGDHLQKMYNITFRIGNTVLQSMFGICQSTASLSTKYEYLQYQFNHQNILILGGGYTGDILHQYNKKDAKAQFQYVLDMGLNTIRLEGKWPPKWWYDMADEMGVLIMPGIECCDAWQNWKAWKDEQYDIANKSITSVVKNFRIHPSIFTFLASSDELPPNDVQNLYNQIFADQSFSRPTVASAADDMSSITNKTGVKMSGPYAWVPPNYWLESTPTSHSNLGGAFGFLTEGGPGASPMSFDSLKLTIPSTSYWPIDDVWNYHCGATTGNFGSLDYFTPPLNARYGESNSAEEYSYKSSVASYESHRAMFEAYARNKYVASTGIIHWMLSNGWPGMIWNLYDYFLNVNGAYFATKKALKYEYGYHAMYSYDDSSIWIITDNQMKKKNSNKNEIICIAHVRDVMNGGNILHSQNVTISIAEMSNDDSKQLFLLDITQNNNLDIFLVHLLMVSAENDNLILDESVYWLNPTMDELDWKRSTWYNTPVSKYADFTKLQALKNIQLKINESTTIQTINGHQYYHSKCCIENTSSDTVAFMIQAKMIRETDETTITPIIWSDNLITIFPKDIRCLSASYLVQDVGENVKPKLNVSLYNNL